ncbi:hypothetical protein [Sphingomonas japonica]|uniref:5-bromo-4-chloroindolyl phosphate hydrolysis protein n=1 Tax=Sphingomonas japonica TaxID=511662 RepID=A0ABX0U040_9SPHN|nr:hypothetical protein [Sphingomonas japonica]NIJ23939.1 hypothetical protein [Sphingomonas japonica]
MRFLIWTFVFGVLLTFGVAIARIFARTAAAFGIASIGSLGLALSLGHGPFEFFGILLLSWIPLFALTIALFARLDRRRPSALDQPRPIQPAPALPPEDRRRHAAWSALAREGDWAASRVAVARTSCERFLKVADDSGMIVETEGLAIRIRKHIPAHIETCLAHAADATPAERRLLVEEALATVERVGAEADRLREEIKRRQASDLEVQRRHLERGQ